MTSTRKKLLLREDDAGMIEFALIDLMKRLGQAEKEHSAMGIFAFSTTDKVIRRRSAEKARGVIAEIERILKLVQDAEVEETVVEL